MFSFLKKYSNLVIRLISWLSRQKGWFYPIVLYKFFRQLLRFLIAAESLKLTQVIRYVYMAMGAFNAILALIVMSQIFGVYVPESLREFLIASLKLFIPVMILEGLSDLMEIQLEAFKDLIKRLMNWASDSTPPSSPASSTPFEDGVIKTDNISKIDGVHVDDINTQPQNPNISVEKGTEAKEARRHFSDRFDAGGDFKDNTKKPSVSIPGDVDPSVHGKGLENLTSKGRVTDNFSLRNMGDLYDENYEGSEDNSINWGVVLAITAVALGVSYYMFPDFYHNIYYGIKDKFFPGDRGGGGGVGDAGANIPVVVDPGAVLNNRVNNIVSDPNFTIDQKFSSLNSLEILTANNNYTPEESRVREFLFDRARYDLNALRDSGFNTSPIPENISDSNIFIKTPPINPGDIILTNVSNPASPLTPVSELTPTGSAASSGASTPVNTGSLTPTNVSIPTDIESVTPTPGTPFPSNEG